MAGKYLVSFDNLFTVHRSALTALRTADESDGDRRFVPN